MLVIVLTYPKSAPGEPPFFPPLPAPYIGYSPPPGYSKVPTPACMCEGIWDIDRGVPSAYNPPAPTVSILVVVELEDIEEVKDPPVAPTAKAPPAPSTNLPLRSGVPPVPSHNLKLEGIVLMGPLHITITPIGITVSTLSSTLVTLIVSAFKALVRAVQHASNASNLISICVKMLCISSIF